MTTHPIPPIPLDGTTQTAPAGGGGKRFPAGVSPGGDREQVQGLESGPSRGTARRTGTSQQAREVQAATTQRGGTNRAPGSDGTRTFTIELPAGLELLNSNDRDGHWARRKRITLALRQATGWVARCKQIPPLGHAHILAVYEPPDRRRRDPANLYPSVKACVDGLVDVGVLPDDDAKHLEGPDMRLGEVHRLGRIVLHVTEVTA